jgi:hypothetical protein
VFPKKRSIDEDNLFDLFDEFGCLKSNTEEKISSWNDEKFSTAS